MISLIFVLVVSLKFRLSFCDLVISLGGVEAHAESCMFYKRMQSKSCIPLHLNTTDTTRWELQVLQQHCTGLTPNLLQTRPIVQHFQAI